MPGWHWVFTPGHTPGHVSLFRAADRTLIAGDAFVTLRQESALAVLSRRQEVRRPPAYYTADWIAARHSVEKLAAYGPRSPRPATACRCSANRCGKGWPGSSPSGTASPCRRRAATSAGPPWRTPGVWCPSPPPVFDRQLVPVVGVALATALGVGLIAQRKS